jgi:hypothetical protein
VCYLVKKKKIVFAFFFTCIWMFRTKNTKKKLNDLICIMVKNPKSYLIIKI